MASSAQSLGVGDLSSNARLLQYKYEGSIKKLVLASLCAFTCALSFGYTIGYSSPAIPQMEKLGILDTKQLSSLFGSLLPVGALIGSVIGGFMIDKYGRRKTLIILNFPFALGWLLICDATGVILVMIGRFLTGVASGMVTVSCPVYIAETSTRKLRGTIGSGTQLFITIGILLAYMTGLHLSYSKMAVLGIITAFISSVLVTFLPETPRWYLLKDMKKEALQSLTLLRGPHTNVHDECRDLEDGIDNKEQIKWKELLTSPQLFIPLKIGVLLMIFQQTSGINAIMFYTQHVFNAAGYTNAGKATVMIGFTQVVATTAACFLMDRAGRRLLLIIGGALMTFTCFLFACYYYITFNYLDTSISWLAVTSLVLYIIGFSLGWGPIPVLLMSEIFPNHARGRASSVAMVTNWLTGFFVSVTFLTLQETITSAGTFILFGACCFAGIIYVWKAVPETKGKSLEDIEMYFLGKNLVRRTNNDVI